MDAKQKIVNILIGSGINITPKMLKSILQLENPVKEVHQIIKATSFISFFQNHITDEILDKISKTELQKVFKRFLTKDKMLMNENEPIYKEIEIVRTNNIDELQKKKETKINSLIDPNKISDMSKSQNNHLNSDQKISNINTDQNINKKEVNRIGILESAKSSLKYNPLAKEIPSEFQILKDPTGKLYTNGEYDEFYNLTVDKFNQLKKLMRKRSEMHLASNISDILRLSHKVEVSIVGMIYSIRQTKKGNYFLILEDLTARINVLLKKDTENRDNIKIIERTIEDQLVYVEGIYTPGESRTNGIIYANYISKIDIPTDFQPNRSSDPLSIALISDTHIGSKEFEDKLFKRFIQFLKGKAGNKSIREIAGRVKYIIINGDLIDGIGVYPSQKDDLIITDIYDQFNYATKLLSEIPEYITIIYSSGNHEPVRNALPRPAVPNKYSAELINIGVNCIGNPSLVRTHGVNTLIFHGDSMLDMNMLIPSLQNDIPVETMKEFLICRHLAPVYGKKTQIAPLDKDWLVIDKIPEIFHTGHVHINGLGQYRNVTLVNSGCFQTQTDFMKSFGITPTPGIVPIIELNTYKTYELNFKKLN